MTSVLSGEREHKLKELKSPKVSLLIKKLRQGEMLLHSWAREKLWLEDALNGNPNKHNLGIPKRTLQEKISRIESNMERQAKYIGFAYHELLTYLDE